MNAYINGYVFATRTLYLNGRKWERVRQILPPSTKQSTKPWTVLYATDKGDDFSSYDRIVPVR